ncbi:MAG: YoaK family protein [Spirochaetales bacterium]|nr:YoaK family protein [Spirochaetales bacterium]
MNKLSNPSQMLSVSILLTISGGIFDAYTYILKGQVFANAQTSNVVLFGIHLAYGDLSAFRYLFPIAAFVLGGFVCSEIKKWFEDHMKYNWQVIVLIIEAFCVFWVPFLPDKEAWYPVVTCTISFITAIQYSAFRDLKGMPFATTMCTGMLRSSADALYTFLSSKDKKYLEKGLLYLVIIGVFAFGCFVGVLLIRIFYVYTVWICGGIFIVCIILFELVKKTTT